MSLFLEISTIPHHRADQQAVWYGKAPPGIVLLTLWRPGSGNSILQGQPHVAFANGCSDASFPARRLETRRRFFLAQIPQEDCMSISVRRGIAVNLTLDEDALALLRLLSPSKTRLGNLVSELVRAEVTRREERAKIAKELLEGRLPCAS